MKELYVIKFSNGQYSCGMKHFSTDLRFAQVYVNKKLARDQAEHYITSKDRYTGKMIAPTAEYKLVQIEIKEIRDVEVEND
jgi:hypothetical protein